MTRALMTDRLAGADGLTLRAVVRAPLAPTQIRIRASAAGLNFHDLLIVSGKYQASPALPYCPGSECVGEVEEIGKQVSLVRLGDRVVTMTAERGGCLADEVIAEQREVFPAPDLPDAAAAAFPVSYGTALHALRDHGRLRAGEVLLVHGAAGGVGFAALQLGLALGARVITTVNTDAKEALVRAAGAHHVLRCPPGELKAELIALTGGRGVDVALDTLGGDHFDATLRSMAWMGRLLVVGFASGDIPKLEVNHLLLKGCSVHGVFFGRLLKEAPEQVRSIYGELAEHARGWRLAPHVRETVELDDAVRALKTFQDPAVLGKVVVRLGAFHD
jgi:NADPH:quinone reductase